MTYLIGAACSAILYRLGGMKGMNTKFRDFGVPIVFLAVMLFSGHWTWWALLSAILLFAALTTYWDWLFGYDNLYFHGLACGLAMLPLGIAGVGWLAIVAYSLILSLIMGILNWFVNKYQVPLRDWIEELSRGTVIILALRVLFM